MRKLGLAEWGHLAEIFGAIAVVVSLVYVGLQLEQNTQAVRSQTAQQVLDAYSGGQLAVLASPVIAELLVKAEKAEELTPAEALQLDGWVHFMLGNWENAFRNRRNGLLEEELWVSWDAYYRYNFAFGYFRDAWVNNPLENGYTASFMRYVNQEVMNER